MIHALDSMFWAGSFSRGRVSHAMDGEKKQGSRCEGNEVKERKLRMVTFCTANPDDFASLLH
eukprot:752214-Hanusia_phi.AAC.1